MKEIEKPTFVHAKNQTPKKKQNDIVIGEIQGLKKHDIVKFFKKTRTEKLSTQTATVNRQS